jgi:hypothetical protein
MRTWGRRLNMSEEIVVLVPERMSTIAKPGNCARCAHTFGSQRAGGIKHECYVPLPDSQTRVETVEFCSSCFFEVTIGRQDF